MNLADQRNRVLVDIDGVLRDFVAALIRIYQREYPAHKILPIQSRRLDQFFPIREKIYDFIDGPFNREILEDAPPYPGAIEALCAWEKKFEIVIASAQPPAWRFPTYCWLGKNRVPVNEVHMCYDKSRVNGIAILDDFVNNLEAFEATGRLAVCMDRPWNQHWEGARVKSVNEYFEYVQTYFASQQDAENLLLA